MGYPNLHSFKKRNKSSWTQSRRREEAGKESKNSWLVRTFAPLQYQENISAVSYYQDFSWKDFWKTIIRWASKNNALSKSTTSRFYLFASIWRRFRVGTRFVHTDPDTYSTRPIWRHCDLTWAGELLTLMSLWNLAFYLTVLLYTLFLAGPWKVVAFQRPRKL